MSGKIRLYSGTVAVEARGFVKSGIDTPSGNPSYWEGKKGRSRVQGIGWGRGAQWERPLATQA